MIKGPDDEPGVFSDCPGMISSLVRKYSGLCGGGAASPALWLWSRLGVKIRLGCSILLCDIRNAGTGKFWFDEGRACGSH